MAIIFKGGLYYYMKKYYYISIAYLIIALISGLFYHEVEYYTSFTDYSTLKYLHSHTIILGTLVFLLVPVFIKVFSIDTSKYFKKFIVVYNLGLIMSLFFMAARGITQLFSMPISSVTDHMIGGLAGIGHIILTIGMYYLFRTLLSSLKENM